KGGAPSGLRGTAPAGRSAVEGTAEERDVEDCVGSTSETSSESSGPLAPARDASRPSRWERQVLLGIEFAERPIKARDNRIVPQSMRHAKEVPTNRRFHQVRQNAYRPEPGYQDGYPDAGPSTIVTMLPALSGPSPAHQLFHHPVEGQLELLGCLVSPGRD